MKITLIIPVYNESTGIKDLYGEIVAALKDTQDSYEILFVDDGSNDDSIDVIKELDIEEGFAISVISFSRNFGHQAALRAGYKYAKGDVVICMDADLQHPPTIIKQLISEHLRGNDVVSAHRDDSDSKSYFKKYTSALFYLFWSWMTGVKLKSGSSDFRLTSKQVVDSINHYDEQFLFIRGLIPQLGFRQSEILYKPNNRVYGESKYTLSKMLRLSKHGLMWGSIRPLRLASLMAFVTALIAIGFGAQAVYSYFFLDGTVKGWTTLISVISLVGSLQLIAIGILGEYLGQTLSESRKRPIFHIDKNKTSKSIL